mmetsp:Transcript_30465/g.55122  ORF Transcript_30465/g.55122 Transcript_30465/m.55122 type:complete len:232 (-) Transcript_30465:35-730(-)
MRWRKALSIILLTGHEKVTLKISENACIQGSLCCDAFVKFELTRLTLWPKCPNGLMIDEIATVKVGASFSMAVFVFWTTNNGFGRNILNRWVSNIDSSRCVRGILRQFTFRGSWVVEGTCHPCRRINIKEAICPFGDIWTMVRSFHLLVLSLSLSILLTDDTVSHVNIRILVFEIRICVAVWILESSFYLRILSFSLLLTDSAEVKLVRTRILVGEDTERILERNFIIQYC